MIELPMILSLLTTIVGAILIIDLFITRGWLYSTLKTLICAYRDDKGFTCIGMHDFKAIVDSECERGHILDMYNNRVLYVNDTYYIVNPLAYAFLTGYLSVRKSHEISIKKERPT
jgi:hypothetical protein